MIDIFYAVNVVDINMALRVKWLYCIGKHTIAYKVLEMIFQYEGEKEVVLRVINIDSKKVVSVHSMTSLVKHRDTEWVV